MAKALTKAQLKAKIVENKKAEISKEMVTLENVVDARNGKFYSVANVKDRHAKRFVPVDEYEG